MSRVSDYLQEHLLGEVTVEPEVRQHLSHDASVLEITPTLAVYPRDENDVRKTARFCWQLAERGKILPITMRGGGSDTTAAAIGSGIIMITPAHLNRILELDPKKQEVIVEPGITYDKLSQTLYTHGLFLPPHPTSGAYATIGGGLANNTFGANSIKYGRLGRYVKNLRVVLANGELIETGPVTKRELNRKMGLSSLEGQIYRALDALLEENFELANQPGNAYHLADVLTKESFDLTPLMIGSQGTLGIITEATFKLEPHNPETILMLISLNGLGELAEVLPKILALKPSLCDIVSQAAFNQVARVNPNFFANTPEAKSAALHLFVEFDDLKAPERKKKARAVGKAAEQVDGDWISAEGIDDQQPLQKLRDSLGNLVLHSDNARRAVPIAEDVIVPPNRLPEFLAALSRELTSSYMADAWWGHAGEGIIRLHAQLDLSQLGDRQKYFKLADSVTAHAQKLGGSLSASAAYGRTKAPHLQANANAWQLNRSVKEIFDPHGILNPGVKFTTFDDVKNMMRDNYSLAHRHEHWPKI